MSVLNHLKKKVVDTVSKEDFTAEQLRKGLQRFERLLIGLYGSANLKAWTVHLEECGHDEGRLTAEMRSYCEEVRDNDSRCTKNILTANRRKCK